MTVPPASRFTSEQKRDIVLELLAGRPMVEIVREHQVTGTAVYRWRDAFLEGGLRGFESKRFSAREKEMEAEIERLKKCIGDLAVANHLLKGGTIRSRGNTGGRR